MSIKNFTLIALVVLVALLAASRSDGASTRTAPVRDIGGGTGELLVYDSWVGTRLDLDYSHCAAVGLVHVTGVYDVLPQPDGSIYISVGMTNRGNSITVTVDGLYRHCFGQRR